MSSWVVYPVGSLRGELVLPGDKSISHRAAILAAIARGTSRIEGFLPGRDCQATLDCLAELGVAIERPAPETVVIEGRGLWGLRAPSRPLDCVRSGTTMRLLTGLLAGQGFTSTLTGDPQLLRRPMERVAVPLRRMGADVRTTGGHAPIVVRGGRLRGGVHELPIPSAQVKSAILLAGLYADGPTVVHQPGPARDHTERMLAAMGASVQVEGLSVTLTPGRELSALSIRVPGDLSSAAFLIVAATLVPDSEVVLRGVGVNPTRTGLLDLLQEMGASVEVEPRAEQGGEPVADLTVRGASLVGVEVGGDLIVRAIDELPILAVAATQARGTTVVRDAGELRVKETDRIATLVEELQRLGADIEPRPDGFVVQGPTRLRGGEVYSHGDHRLAMALAVAGLVADGPVTVEGAECVADSFPGFWGVLERLGGKVLARA